MKRKLLSTIRRFAALLVSAAALVLAIAWMAGAFREKVLPGRAETRGATAAPDAPVVPLESRVEPIHEEAPGAVQSSRRTAVSSRILASIREIRVNAGDVVKAGDPLVLLDDRDIRSRIQQAEQALRSAEALETQARVEFERQKKLFADGVASKSAFDAAEAAARVGLADVERGRKALEEAQILASFATIAAPVDGRVVERLAEPGDTASPGVVLLQIYDPASLQLTAAVRESLAARLRVGDPVRVRIDALGSDLDGSVAEIIPQAEVGSRVFRVKVNLPPRADLYTGMSGRLVLKSGERAMILVPEAAVTVIGQNRFVTVVASDRSLDRRLVTLGRPRPDGQVEVLSGLAARERILLTTAPAPR